MSNTRSAATLEENTPDRFKMVNGDARVLFMLTDDFDLHDLNREVVYDSLFDDHAEDSIQDRIGQANGSAFLNSCFKDQFLELVCMVVRNDHDACIQGGTTGKAAAAAAVKVTVESSSDSFASDEESKDVGYYNR